MSTLHLSDSLHILYPSAELSGTDRSLSARVPDRFIKDSINSNLITGLIDMDTVFLPVNCFGLRGNN